MSKTPFIWLGSRRSRKFPLSQKAAQLDVASSRGLPVPNGGVLLHELYQLLVTESVLQQADDRIIAADPQWLFETIYDGVRFPRLDHAVAVRASFALVDGENDPQAVPAGPARLHVDFTDPEQLTDALCDMWSRAVGKQRRDVMVMEMVECQEAGTAVSLPGHEVDQVVTERTTLELARLVRWQQPAPGLQPYARRLQRLLRGVRRTFGALDAWQIEWADDGKICWLLQVQRLQ